MLLDVAVRQLGVIEEIVLALPRGMIALTGETGAGKTLVVEALDLLIGGRADGVQVRPGADEALVEGRFLRFGESDRADDELVVARAVPASGRSRAWVDGRMAPVGQLAETAGGLVDLHGQHAHQALLRRDAQRAALDRFGRVDLTALTGARRRLQEIESELAALGGDGRARARRIDVLRFQIAEIDLAAITDDGEEAVLEAEEERLAQAGSLRDAAATALGALSETRDSLAEASAALRGRPALAEHEARTCSAAVDVADLAGDLRRAAEEIVDDPERLEIVRARRALLRDLCRKYGSCLADVAAYGDVARAELALSESADERGAVLEAALASGRDAVAAAEEAVREARAGAAPRLAAAVAERLADLGMVHALVDVRVGSRGAGDDVEILLGANRGEPALPLGQVASGGELARAMLAVHLVLGGTPPTIVFDEVDAGIGGEAAVAVARALKELSQRGSARGRASSGAEIDGPEQVVVVTHLAQIAAFADHHVVVTKRERGGRTVAEAKVVTGEDRVAELSRMLSGRPSSTTAHAHARELLEQAAAVGAPRVAAGTSRGGR